MKCLILAAGYATRLYPLTENYPKPLLDVGGKTILDWLIGDIDSCGKVDEFIVISNHRFATHFEKWAAERPWNIRVLDDGTSTNETRLGAVRDMQFAIETCDIDDDILVIAGDNVLDFSLVKFIEFALATGTSCVMRYHEPSEERLHKCGVMTIDDNSRIVSMVEKPKEPPSHWCCPPFYFYTRADAKRIADGIAAGCGTDAPGSFVAWLSGQAPVHAMEMPGSRYDIGNLEGYNRIRKEYKGITR